MGHGVLAQLGARNIRIVEARGSTPLYSIICGKEGPTNEVRIEKRLLHP